MNMIPGNASCTVVLRAPTGGDLEVLIERAKKCAEGGSVATGSELRTEPTSLTHQHMKFNTALNEMFLKNLNTFAIVEDYPEATLKASTDAGNISQIIPTLHPMIAICGPEASPHTKEFEKASISPRGEETFLSCAKAMAMTAVEILASPQKLESIRKCR
jgi:metal-dependent amidase/aminoacylase/carboxypeptidase family protein